MRKLLKFLKPYAFLIFLVVLLVFCQVVCELAMPNVMSDIVNNGILNNKGITYILQRGGVMIAIAIGAMFAVFFVNYLSAKISMGFGAKVRSAMFKKVQQFSLEEMSKFGTSSLITRTTNDVLQVQTLVYMVLRMMLMAPLMFIGGIVFAINMDATLTMVLIVSIPLIVILIVSIGAVAMPVFKSMQKKMDNLTVVTREGLTGIRVVRAFNQQEREKKRFDTANSDLVNTTIRGNRLMSILMPCIMLVMNLTTVAVVWIGAFRVEGGFAEAGNIMAVMQYVMQIMFSLVMIAMIFIMIPRALVSAQRVSEVLDTPITIHDGHSDSGTICLDEINSPSENQADTAQNKTLEFKDVTFHFPNAEEPTLHHINFELHAGETLAIIGSTGSGKSTIINLIPRFFDVTEGEIILNGVNIKDMPIDELRKKIGFVPQKSNLFKGTIAENIRFGKEDASLQEMQEAAKIAQAEDFIESLDKKYDSYVAQGGTNFSGGQKQRLCITRAVVRRPELYVFDDSFSALDFKTDSKLRAALKKITGDSMVIIVAQRLSTIMDADKIVVLEDGKMVGIGTHKQLVANCDVYREIAESQLEKSEI